MKKKILLFIGTSVLFIGILFYLPDGPLPENSVITETPQAIGDGDNPFARIEYERQMLADPATGKIPADIRRKELQFAKGLPRVESGNLKKGAVGTVWSSHGPINRGGRTRALAVDVRTQTPGSVILIAAGVSGGIFKSTDDGQTWVNKLSPDLIHSATCVVQDIRAGHEDTWYVGSGETIGNSAGVNDAPFYGNGIFKSMDNGETWEQIPSTVTTFYTASNTFQKIHRLAINPITGSLYAAAGGIVYRSDDEWATFSKLQGSYSGSESDVVITPSGTIYVSIESGHTESGVFKSTNDGDGWTDITPAGFPAGYDRIIAASAPSDTGIVYFFLYTPGLPPNLSQVWKYNATDGSWANLTDNMPTGSKKLGNLSSQRGYDMIIKVKPDDPNFVVIGGIQLYRTTDGFSSKMDTTDWLGGYWDASVFHGDPSYHADQHSLVFLSPPNSTVLYSGSDGGVLRLDDVSGDRPEWVNLNTGYITSQFYSLAIDPQTPSSNVMIGGLQDNGNYFVNSRDGSQPWKQLPFGGDGGMTALSTGRTDYYIETQKGALHRIQLDDNGNTIQNTLIRPLDNTTHVWVTPFLLDPNDNKMIYYAAGDSVWLNTDVTAIPWGNRLPTAINWSPIGVSQTGTHVTAMGISKTPANRLYVGSKAGKVLRIDDANGAAPFVTDISAGLPGYGYVICIYVDPDDADDLVVVFSNYGIKSLFRSQDGGFDWISISGNLEDGWAGVNNGPSCRWFTKMVSGGVATYYTATSVGLFSTIQLDGDATIWKQEGAETIGNLVCPMVVARSTDGLVAVATHGAGIYSNQTGLSADPVVYFPSRRDFTAANEPTAVATGDLNADGREDLAVVTEAPPYGLYVLLNTMTDGDRIPSFDTKHLLNFRYGPPSSVAIGDLNGDGLQDMAVVFSGWTYILVYLNATTPGDTSLIFNETGIPANDIHSKIIIGDLNKDGKPDLAASSGGTSDTLIAVFLNQTPDGATTAVFSDAAEFASGQKPSSLAMADMNNDGMPDLVCTNYFSFTFSLLLNTADSGAATIDFSEHSDVFLGTYNYPASIGIGDMNNDGKPDVAISSDAFDSVFVYLNAMTGGSFTPAFSDKFKFDTGLHFPGSRSVTVKDLNGDNRAEFVTGNLSSNSITIFENHTPDGSFIPTFLVHHPLASGQGPQSVTTGDFNGDKKPDLVTANWSVQTVSVFLNSTEFTVSGIPTPKPIVPQKFTLGQNYPNPFNPTTHIRFSIPKDSDVRLEIYDMLGRQVRELLNEKLAPGNYNRLFDGSGLASGIYIYRLLVRNRDGEFSDVKKMALIK